MMKIGIDSYCYHRFFGDVYPQQKAAERAADPGMVPQAREGAEGGRGRRESPFIPRFDACYLSEVKGMLDEYKLDRVFAWGHPDGLEGGRNEKAFADMMKSIEYAAAIGAKVMRVCGASLMFRNEPHGPMLEKLTRMFSEAVKVAAKHDIRIADENHIDFNSDEMLAPHQGRELPLLRDQLRHGQLHARARRSDQGHGEAGEVHLLHPREGPEAQPAGRRWTTGSSSPPRRSGTGWWTTRSSRSSSRTRATRASSRWRSTSSIRTTSRRGQGRGRQHQGAAAHRQQPELGGNGMKKLNVGIVGYKFMGKAHSNAWKKAPLFFDMEVKPVLKVACGRHEESLKAFAERWGWEQTESDWKKMVHRDDVDIVDISAPQYLHYEIAMEAARAGKHIFCEKPLAMNLAQAKEMYELAEKKGITHYINHNYRRCPAVRLAKKLIDEGKIGRIFHWRGCYLQSWIVDPKLPPDLAPAEGVRRLRAAGRPELAQRGPGALPRRGDQEGHRHDGALHHGEAAARRGGLGHLQRESEGRGEGQGDRRGRGVHDRGVRERRAGLLRGHPLRPGPQELQLLRDLRQQGKHPLRPGADERAAVLLATRIRPTRRASAPSSPPRACTTTSPTGGRPGTSSATSTSSCTPWSTSSRRSTRRRRSSRTSTTA